MTKIPTLYSDYRECMLDLDIYGKIVATPQQSIQELTETLFEEFQRRKPMPTLEYKRYELSRLVNPDFRIAYNKELELQDNERLLDLQSDLEASFENIDFEDLTSLIPTAKELFSYENHVTDNMRNEIISKYDLSTGEEFKPGISQTENIIGSVVEDDDLTLSEEKIAQLGVDESEVEVDMAEDPMEVVSFADDSDETKYEVDDDEVGLECDYSADDDEEYDYTSEESEDYTLDEDENEPMSSESDYDLDSEDTPDGYDDYDSYDSDDESEVVENQESIEDSDDYDDYDSESKEDSDAYDDYDSESKEDLDDYDDYDSDEENEESDSDEDDYEDYDSESDEDQDDYKDYDSESDEDQDDYGSETETVQPTEEAKEIIKSKVNTTSSGVVEKSIDLNDDDFDVDFFIDSVQDEPVTKQSEPIINKVVEIPITPLEAHSNNPPQAEIIDRSAEPTEIRAFLRKHPRCEYDFALKYFTKKQINDAIKIGKIIKKGNILKI